MGDLSNPLLVVPLQPAPSPVVFSTDKNESDGPKLSNLVGPGYQAFENSVLEKLKKVEELHKRILLFNLGSYDMSNLF